MCWPERAIENWASTFEEITNNQGPDIILEMVANLNLKKDIEMIAQGGRIIPIGGGGIVDINTGLLLSKRITIAGVGIFTVPTDELQEDAALSAAGLEQGWLKPVIGREYPMEKTIEAHKDITGGNAKGKMVITVCEK